MLPTGPPASVARALGYLGSAGHIGTLTGHDAKAITTILSRMVQEDS